MTSAFGAVPGLARFGFGDARFRSCFCVFALAGNICGIACASGFVEWGSCG